MSVTCACVKCLNLPGHSPYELGFSLTSKQTEINLRNGFKLKTRVIHQAPQPFTQMTASDEPGLREGRPPVTEAALLWFAQNV